jgi:hypothetical protein
MSTFSGIERSDYYREAVAEKAALDTHKWFLSERAGHDVGHDYAQWNWIMAGHRGRWLEAYRKSGTHSQ